MTLATVPCLYISGEIYLKDKEWSRVAFTSLTRTLDHLWPLLLSHGSVSNLKFHDKLILSIV